MLTLRWQDTAPVYRSDLNTYVGQPFREPPPFTYVTIFMLNKGEPRNLRVLLLFQSRLSLDAIRSVFVKRCFEMISECWLPVVRVVSTVIAAFQVALYEIISFLKQVSKQIVVLVRSFGLAFRNCDWLNIELI